MVLETMATVAKEAGKTAIEKVRQDAEKIKNMKPEDISELAKKGIENIEDQGKAVVEKLNDIKGLTPDQLMEKMDENLKSAQRKIESNEKGDAEGTEDKDEVKEGLTDEEKAKIKEETGWSDEIINSISSMEEYEIYRKAGLVEAEIGGKKCLIRSDIDWEKKWETGKYDENGNPIYETNQERVAKGKAPLDNNGNPIQLHHIGQHADSPLAELTFEEHRCNGNDTILHDKSISSETHGEGNNWDAERQEYWKNRAEYNNGGNDNAEAG